MSRFTLDDVRAVVAAQRFNRLVQPMHDVARSARLHGDSANCRQADPRKQETPSTPMPEVSTRRSATTEARAANGQSDTYRRP